ncbi:hypothetical protein LX36DRAFT_649694 [Colletotrichum falcatum]|nr:hypothetical protein LX36DRAFT_649694 [Colletotrichum falcatum]
MSTMASHNIVRRLTTRLAARSLLRSFTVTQILCVDLAACMDVDRGRRWRMRRYFFSRVCVQLQATERRARRPRFSQFIKLVASRISRPAGNPSPSPEAAPAQIEIWRARGRRNTQPVASPLLLAQAYYCRVQATGFSGHGRR